MEERTFAEELREGRRTGTYKFIPDENSANNIMKITNKLKTQAKENNKKDKRTVNVYLAYDDYNKEWKLLPVKGKLMLTSCELNVYENEVQMEYYKENIARQLKNLGFSKVSVKIKSPSVYTYLKPLAQQGIPLLSFRKQFKRKRPLLLYKLGKDTTLKIKFSW